MTQSGGFHEEVPSKSGKIIKVSTYLNAQKKKELISRASLIRET